LTEERRTTSKTSLLDEYKMLKAHKETGCKGSKTEEGRKKYDDEGLPPRRYVKAMLMESHRQWLCTATIDFRLRVANTISHATLKYIVISSMSPCRPINRSETLRA